MGAGKNDQRSEKGPEAGLPRSQTQPHLLRISEGEDKSELRRLNYLKRTYCPLGGIKGRFCILKMRDANFYVLFRGVNHE